METKIEVKMIEWFDDHFYKIKCTSLVNGIPIESSDYFPSVTTKLQVISKPFIARWRGDIGNREADLRMFEASERGVRIHHAWYTMTTGGIVIYNPWQHPNYTEEEIQKLSSDNFGNIAIVRYQDEMYDLYKLQRWLQIVKPKILGSELINYSVKNRDAGTLDNLFEIEEGKYLINGKEALFLPGGVYVVDLKSGNNVDDDAFMQTGDYAFNVQEMGIASPVGTLILHTGAKTRTGIEGLSTLYRSKEQMEQDYQDYRLAAALWERKNGNMKPKVFEFPTLLNFKGESNEDFK